MSRNSNKAIFSLLVLRLLGQNGHKFSNSSLIVDLLTYHVFVFSTKSFLGGQTWWKNVFGKKLWIFLQKKQNTRGLLKLCVTEFFLLSYSVMILYWDWFVLKQGIDGSARKPALIQDTGYMVEKTYQDIATYLVAFGAYLMPQ